MYQTAYFEPILQKNRVHQIVKISGESKVSNLKYMEDTDRMEPGPEMSRSNQPIHIVTASKSLDRLRRSQAIPLAVEIYYYDWESADVQLFLNTNLEQLKVVSYDEPWKSSAKEIFFHQLARLTHLPYLVLRGVIHIREFELVLRRAPCFQHLVSLSLSEDFRSKSLLNTVKAVKYFCKLVEIKLYHLHRSGSKVNDPDSLQRAVLATAFLEVAVGKIVLEGYPRNREFQVALLHQRTTKSGVKPIQHAQLTYTSSKVFVKAAFSAMERSSRNYGQCSLARLTAFSLGSPFRAYLLNHVMTLVSNDNWYYSF